MTMNLRAIWLHIGCNQHTRIVIVPYMCTNIKETYERTL